LSLPSCFDQVVRVSRTKPSLGILKDRLCFSYDIENHFVLWQMNEYGVENSWTQLLKLSYQALQIDCTTQEYCILPPLGTLKNDHLILIESVDDRLQATILSKKEGNAKIPMNMLWLYTRDYVPSLISPSQNSFFLIRNPPRNCRGFISRIRSQWKDSLTKVQKC
jgi:hypothetical protein